MGPSYSTHGLLSLSLVTNHTSPLRCAYVIDVSKIEYFGAVCGEFVSRFRTHTYTHPIVWSATGELDRVLELNCLFLPKQQVAPQWNAGNGRNEHTL